jgi:hypothetical protein
MCDYSATGVKQRAAVKEETLVSGIISRHTNGFVGVNDSSTAVCLLPGTELAFEKPVRALGPLFRLSATPAGSQTVATFVQVNKDQPSVHHDALQFVDGKIILLNDLTKGQRAVVVQLPADPSTLQGKERENAVANQNRAAYT